MDDLNLNLNSPPRDDYSFSEGYTMITPVEDYVASTYEAPPVFSFVGAVLERIIVGRDIAINESPNSILAYVSGDRSSQVRYIEGMFGIGIFLCCVVSLWFTLLVVLKCYGRDRVGCAAGYPFHDSETDKKQSFYQESKQRYIENEENNSVMAAAVGDNDSIMKDAADNDYCDNRNNSRSRLGGASASGSNNNGSSFYNKFSNRNSKSNTETETARSKSSSKSSLSHADRMALSASRLSSMFGGGGSDKKSKESRKESAASELPSHYDDDVPIWSISKSRSLYNDNSTKSSGKKLAEEIELHMELDKIVRSATTEDSAEDKAITASSKKSGSSWWRKNKNNNQEVQTLRSIPPRSKKDAARIVDENVDGDGQDITKNNDNNGTTLFSYPRKSKSSDDDDDDDDDDPRKFCCQNICCSFQPKHVARRKTMTRIVYGFFSIVSLVCCALLMTHMYIPLESAAITSQGVIEQTTDIVNEMNDVLDTLNETATIAIDIMETTPLEYETICPEFPVEQFKASFGFDPNDIISTIGKEYSNYIPTVVESLTVAKSTSNSITNVLLDVNEASATANEYLWIVPVIICATILVIFSTLALFFAVVYGESGKRGSLMETPAIEHCYGWTILPLQTFIVISSWILVILFCFGIIVTTDSCTPSLDNMNIVMNSNKNNNNLQELQEQRDIKFDVEFVDTTIEKIDVALDELTGGRGTPDDTVLAVLDQYISEAVTSMTTNSDDGTTTTNTDEASYIDDIAYQRLSMYVTGCGGSNGSNGSEDPLQEMIMVQSLLKESLEYVDTQINFAKDVLGLDFIQEMCGLENNRVELFFNNVNTLNNQLLEVNDAITKSYDALNCPRVNKLYQDAVHTAFCTDFATANTNGLLLLVAISFSGMILITLRSSWRSAT